MRSLFRHFWSAQVYEWWIPFALMALTFQNVRNVLALTEPGQPLMECIAEMTEHGYLMVLFLWVLNIKELTSYTNRTASSPIGLLWYVCLSGPLLISWELWVLMNLMCLAEGSSLCLVSFYMTHLKGSSQAEEVVPEALYLTRYRVGSLTELT